MTETVETAETTEPVTETEAPAEAAPREPVVIDRPIQTVGRRKEAVVRVRLVPVVARGRRRLRGVRRGGDPDHCGSEHDGRRHAGSVAMSTGGGFLRAASHAEGMVRRRRAESSAVHADRHPHRVLQRQLRALLG